MFSIERRNEILKYLRENYSATVDSLAAKFFVSEATLRRDLNKLAKDGLIKRTHGGAVICEGSANDFPFILRESVNPEAKEKIASIGVRFINNGETIMLDSSSTVLKIIPYLSDLKGVTVITNGIKTTASLCKIGIKNVYCCGGTVRENSYSLVGAAASDFLSVFNADTYLFSCSGLSLAAGVTEKSEEEAIIKRKMFSASKTRILLCDSSKINSVSLSRVCNLENIDIIISEAMFPDEYIAFFKKHGITYFPNNSCSEDMNRSP